MEGFLGGAYLWVKAFHIIFVIFWMAGMFMLPRYLAYHAECAPGSDEDRAWIDREKRLLKIIINPAMIITWILGILLVINIGLEAGGWLHVKLLLVFLLSGFHGKLARHTKDFAKGLRKHDSKYFRRINEIPAVFIILIVLMVVPKAF